MSSSLKQLKNQEGVFINLKGLNDIFKDNHLYEIITKSDIESMRSDWEVTGSDIKWAMEKIKPSLKERAI